MSSRRPEKWSAEGGTSGVAKLDVPADLQRERRFEIDVRLRVVNKLGRADATHALKVLVNGSLEWSRSASTPAHDEDSLELRLHRVVPVGRPLRVSASSELRGAQRLGLAITAEEQLPP